MELQKKENILIKARELSFRFCIDNIIKDGFGKKIFLHSISIWNI